MGSEGEVSVASRLAQARLFLRNSLSKVDKELPSLLEVLEDAGASECFHKHGTFFEHLFHVYRILKLWNMPDSVARCGLFHSSYSNSYVNLAIFRANVDRQRVRDLIGEVAEELVYLFCVVPRQQLIFDNLLFHFTDEDLSSELAYKKHGKGCQDNISELENLGIHERKTRNRPLIPPEGITVKHIRTGEDLQVSRQLIAIFLVLTMADFIDQLYGWQDELFDNDDAKLLFEGETWYALWPGDGKPGLWMSAISRMGALLNIILQDEKELEKGENSDSKLSRPFSEIKFRVPPIFNNCTYVLSPSDLIRSRDLYWEAMFISDKSNVLELAEPLLTKAIKYNPFIAEPHLVLAQIFLSKQKYGAAQQEAAAGLKLLLEWGTQWDKRMTWEGWIAWARVLEQNAKNKTWPNTSWGIISLGLVE